MLFLTSRPSPDTVPDRTPVLVGATVGSFAFLALLIGIFLFLCRRRRRTKGNVRSAPIDLSADDKPQILRPSPSIFVPFEYRPRPPSSSREEASDYGHSSSPGGRMTGSPSSQALLFGWDSTTPSKNPQSSYSMYSRGTTSSGTQWGEVLSVRNSALAPPTPHSPLTPSVPPIQEKRPLVATNASERDPTSPVAVNRLPSGAPSPPPYSAKRF